MYKKIFAVIALSLLAFCFQPEKSDAESLIIVTAGAGGTYYPVGVGIGTLISLKLAAKHGIMATAISSAGSIENIIMLRNGEAQLGMLQSHSGLEARQGNGIYQGKPVRNIMAATMLWDNVEHFIVGEKYAKSGTMEDLRKLRGRFSAGKRGSGSENSTQAIFKALDIKPGRDLTMEYLGYGTSAQIMMDGRLAGMNAPAGPPAAAVTRLFARMGAKNVRILEFTDRQLESVRQKYPVWRRYVIKAGVYPGQKRDIRTISQGNFLAVREDVSENTVYLIVKTIYENLPFLVNIHKIVKNMDVNKAIEGLPVPLHPGAARYYREKGLTIPANLKPELSGDAGK